jgi:putative tricarboxylic transport membrane protein
MTFFRRDIISSAFFGVGAMTLYLYVLRFPVREGQPAAVSAGFYPRILAAILAVLAVVQLAQAILVRGKARNALAPGGASMDETPAASPAPRGTARTVPPIWKDRASLRLFLVAVTALVAYPFLMRLVGFSITGLAFLGTLIFALSPDQRRGKGLVFILAITLAIGLVTFVVFRYFLNIPFPPGILFDR